MNTSSPTVTNAYLGYLQEMCTNHVVCIASVQHNSTSGCQIVQPWIPQAAEDKVAQQEKHTVPITETPTALSIPHVTNALSLKQSSLVRSCHWCSQQQEDWDQLTQPCARSLPMGRHYTWSEVDLAYRCWDHRCVSMLRSVTMCLCGSGSATHHPANPSSGDFIDLSSAEGKVSNKDWTTTAVC